MVKARSKVFHHEMEMEDELYFHYSSAVLPPKGAEVIGHFKGEEVLQLGDTFFFEMPRKGFTNLEFVDFLIEAL